MGVGKAPFHFPRSRALLPDPAYSSGAAESFWFGAAPALPTFEPLRENTTADVVVGAGIVGLATTYLLAKEGCRVVVLEDRDIASGETDRTTAPPLFRSRRPLHHARKHVRRRRGAAGRRQPRPFDLVGQIVRDERIDCDFARLDGYLFLPAGGMY